MQWHLGSTRLDFDDIGLRAAYQPRHAASKRHQQSRASVQWRASVAGEAGLDAARAQSYAHHQAAASCQSYGFAPVSIRQLLRDRAATLIRVRYRRQDGGELSLQRWA